MSKFNVGDKVVNLTAAGIEKGKTYTVSEVVGLWNGIYLEGFEQLGWYNKSCFELAKPKFDMKTNPWVIYVNNEQEYNLARDFVISEGFEFTFSSNWKADLVGISNASSVTGEVWDDGLLVRISDGRKVHKNIQEIKINTKLVLDSVTYPEYVNPEIAKLENQIKELMKKLEELKGE